MRRSRKSYVTKNSFFILSILSIDPGLKVTGLSWFLILKTKTERYFWFKCYTINIKGKDHSKKLKDLFDKLWEFIPLIKPDIVLIESIFVTLNWRTAMIIAYAKGVALLCFPNSHIVDIHNTEVKRTISGTLWYSKELVAKSLSFILNTSLLAGDAIDALGFLITFMIKENIFEFYFCAPSLIG